MRIGDPDWKWHTASAKTRIVAVVCIAAGFGLLAGIMLAGYADYQALLNPAVPAGAYVHAYEVKGTVRFVADDLAQLGRISQWLMFGSLPCIAISWGLFHWLSLREKRSRAVP